MAQGTGEKTTGLPTRVSNSNVASGIRIGETEPPMSSEGSTIDTELEDAAEAILEAHLRGEVSLEALGSFSNKYRAKKGRPMLVPTKEDPEFSSEDEDMESGLANKGGFKPKRNRKLVWWTPKRIKQVVGFSLCAILILVLLLALLFKVFL